MGTEILSREKLRRSFRPARVRLLFIGESPPASGRFFYSRNSGLYRAMREAFRGVDERVDDENFLAMFVDCGCYLIDLCDEPVDDLSPQLRCAKCAAGEQRLARNIARLRPLRIAALLRSIVPSVRNAIAQAGWTGPLLELPYPGRWLRHRAAFVEALTPMIRELTMRD